jgi:signal transduction histidine kinase
MKSIKTRVVFNFMTVILVSVIVFEVLLISSLRNYYYMNIDQVLTNQIKTASDFYSRYFSDTSLEENVSQNVDVFWRQTSAQVQIINTEGLILMDSIGVISEYVIDTPDFRRALSGQKGKWTGNIPYDSYGVMAISYPLRSDNEVIGVLRYITSLKDVNSDIRKISLIFLIIGMIVIIIAGLVSLIMARSIINPIKELTTTAEIMAAGNLDVRSIKSFDDEIGKLSDTLNFMAEEVLKKEQLKNEFISSVSHELRTPLTAIKGWAYILKSEDNSDTEVMETGLSIIEKESERLTAMVEELLDFSRFISDKVTLNKEPVDVSELINQVEKLMEPRASRENIYFSVSKIKNIPPIHLDKNRMKQVLINVLDNAFKFTDTGGSVGLSTTLSEEFFQVIIRDSGCGITEEDLPKVKEKFFKGRSSKSQNGLGLSISDEIVKLHNGKLDISSTLGSGTKVTINLPL